MHVVVIGAGVVGVTTAYLLADAGHQVTLLEREADVASQTSHANGAQLSWSYVESMARPSMLRALPGLFFSRNPAFAVRMPMDLSLLRWGVQFLAQCRAPAFARNARAAFALAARSREVLDALRARLPALAFDYAAPGKLVLYPDEHSLREAAETVPLRHACGIATEVLDRDGCIAQEPALSGYAGPLAGGLFGKDDAVGDALLFSRALLAEAASRPGFSFQPHCRVRRIAAHGSEVSHLETTLGSIRGDVYVLCAGPWAGSLAHTAGLRLPIYPVRGHSLTLPLGEVCPGMSVTDIGRKLVICRLGSRLRIAGFAEFAGLDPRPDADVLALLQSKAREALPRAGDYSASPIPWAGLRPMTPKGLPIIGPSKLRNLLLNVGHGAFGWTWACGSAQAMVDAVLALEKA